MRLTVRGLFMAAVLALAPALAGCGTMWDGANNISDSIQDAIHDFNPFGTAKKPLPGERRAVFPEGVPGVQQGVPRELVRGNPQAEPPPIEAAPAEPPPPAPRTAARRTTQPKSQPRAAPEPDPSDPPEDGVWPPPPRR
jgi:hypothetical protein